MESRHVIDAEKTGVSGPSLSMHTFVSARVVTVVAPASPRIACCSAGGRDRCMSELRAAWVRVAIEETGARGRR